MRIALAYNAKPSARAEIRAHHPDPQSEPEDDPSPAGGVGADADAYAEWDDAETILAVANALSHKGEVCLAEADRRFPERIRRLAPDLVFNIAEGARGPSREAQVPAVLEMLGVPYTGSDPLTLALCLDKARAKEVLSYHGVPTAGFAVVETPAELAAAATVPAPVLVKPLYEGSSKGIRDDQLVRDPAGVAPCVRRVLERYTQPVIVEQFLPGREFTVAVLGNGPALRLLPPVEIRFDGLPPGANPIYSWEAKWVWDRPDAPLQVFDCPARLDPAEAEALERVCRDAVRVLRLRDWARIDLRQDAAGTPHVLEVNPLPGVLPDPRSNSCSLAT
jgi:D-alanine-D-alanine ligase